MTEDLQRLVLDYRSGELAVRCLYRRQSGLASIAAAA
jgi:hypothetical protein